MKTVTIYCHRSGIAIAQVRSLCVEGTPLLTSMSSDMVHPVYGKPLTSILSGLKRGLDLAKEKDWQDMTYKEQQSLQLYASATLWSLGVIEGNWASLPSIAVCIGSGPRLLALANWYHHATSKRLALPRYHPCRDNTNDRWQNISGWLDACMTIKTEWETGKSRLEKVELQKARDASIMEIKKENAGYKRVDLGKVWNWISLQLSDTYGQGRIATWKSLWLSGDIEQENWCQDDIEDLQFAIIECCDCGNEIIYFINQRLKHIKEMIADFYGSFTLLTKVYADGKSAHPDLTPEERAKEEAFFSEIDKQASGIDALPPEPQRADYVTMGQYLKAQAQWRLLSRRFGLRSKEVQS